MDPGVARALRECARRTPARFLENDPIRLARGFASPLDAEIAAILGSFLAFGKVAAFLPKVQSLLRLMEPSPRSYVEAYRHSRDRAFFRAFRSRVYRGDDVRLLLENLRLVFREHASLEDAFLAVPVGEDAVLRLGPHRARLAAFARLLYRADPRPIAGRSSYPPGYRHLVPDPAAGSACKRWNLFLRWVARPADGVDLGIWKRVDPAGLVMPLDIHVARISSLIGIRKRRTPDWKSAEEVTAWLRELDPRDPLRFDFPLSHIGISSRCRGRWVEAICEACRIRRICSVGRSH
jgi:uncharacterized protein (TIGR02757 family)